MNTRCSNFILLTLGWMLAGCALQLPERSNFSMNLPTQWAAGQSSTNAPSGKWWETLGNVELAVLVEEALVNNPDLQVTAVRLEQARLRQHIAGADRRPTLNASLDASKKRSNFIGLPIGGSSVLTSRSENYGFTLSSSWEVDVWGRIRAGQLAASMDTATAQAELRAARQSLAAQTVKAWLALTEARQQLGLAEANVAILETTARQANLRYGLGVAGAGFAFGRGQPRCRAGWSGAMAFPAGGGSAAIGNVARALSRWRVGGSARFAGIINCDSCGFAVATAHASSGYFGGAQPVDCRRCPDGRCACGIVS